jgi:hypothetical protein
MSSAPMKFFHRCAEFLPKDTLNDIPKNTRGIYILFMKNGSNFDAIYIGMSRGEISGIRARLRGHAKSKRKSSAWSHFSLYEVHDNISSSEIEELEGLLRNIYRKDSKAHKFNKQKSYRKLQRIKVNDLKKWNPR